MYSRAIFKSLLLSTEISLTAGYLVATPLAWAPSVGTQATTPYSTHKFRSYLLNHAVVLFFSTMGH